MEYLSEKHEYLGSRSMLRLFTASLLSLFLVASAGFADEVFVKRSYVDLEWGQMHLRTAYPVTLSDASPVVCFAPNPYS